MYTDWSLGLDWLPPASFCRSILLSTSTSASNSTFTGAVSVVGGELIGFCKGERTRLWGVDGSTLHCGMGL